MANAFYTLFAVRCFFVILPLFRCCLQIVYSGLNSQDQIELHPRSARRNGIRLKKWILISLIFPLLRIISRDEWKKLQRVQGAKERCRLLQKHPAENV